ncbi:N-acetyltransferase [Phycicoccus sp. CSK15P-2]|uniref:GNAT family N-acetyltransferase n=1 Tax=Phycicoccus sp. CSK15P-2 TaxID=2807627 RepID=UPI0027DCA691|nr:N-acetyltransferase [Phycicoccus sp. CSK15P-2]
MRADLVIRPEQSTDAPGVRGVLDAAFPVPEGAQETVEARLADALRSDGDVVPGLTFVAELDGEVVGSVVCSRATMGRGVSVGLGPLAVRPDLQRQGIGSALMASVIATADQAAEPSLVLLGDPGYYGHFGFVPAVEHGIGSPGPWDDRYFQVKVLRAWRPQLAGPFRYAPAFERLEES